MKVTTIAQVAKLSAREMKTTARVEVEDPSMKVARPILSKINAAGLVTVDSQMGLKSDYVSVMEKGFVGVTWQRAYVYGFMARESAAAFAARLDLVGGIAIQVCELASKEPSDKAFRAANKIPVTRWSTRDGAFAASTHIPMIPSTFAYLWMNLLPETGLRSDRRAMQLVAPSVVQVNIVDMQWGRPMWLYNQILKALTCRASMTPKAKMGSGV